MQLSVIVPCYNIEGYVDRCLASLRDQGLGPEEYEIIIVDDGSTDATSRIINAHETDDARIVVVRQANRGLSAARNVGLDRATGEFIYFVDGDDYVATGSLPPVVEAMREHSLDLGWVGSQWLAPGDEAAPVRHSAGPRGLDVVSGMEYWAEREWITNVWLYMLRRSYLERTGVRFEVGMLVEDRPFTYNVLADAGRVAQLDEDVYRYVLRPGSIMHDTTAEGNRRVLEGLARAVDSLDELLERKAAEGTADPAFRAKLASLQGNMGFFMITRLIRSQEALRPGLARTLSGLRGAGHYPLESFPDREHDGMSYHLLTRVYNRRALLYPFAFAARAAYRARDGWARASAPA